MEFIIAGLFALGIFMATTAIARSMKEPTRVSQVVGQYQPRMLEEIELAQPFSKRVIIPMLRTIAQTFGRFAPQSIMESTRHKLDLAGNPYGLPPLEFFGLRGLSTILGAVVFAILFAFLRANSATVVLFSLAGAALGFYLPVLWLDLKIRDRKSEIQLTLPDALDLLTICVEAGMGFDAAMGRVAGRWNNALGQAFARVSFEIRLGKGRHEAMRDMANRADVSELTGFIAAVIQSDQLGTGIAKVLRIQSEQMRVTRRQRAQERANQLPVRALFPLVFFIFPSMFIVLLGPAMIRLLSGGLLPR